MKSITGKQLVTYFRYCPISQLSKGEQTIKFRPFIEYSMKSEN